jgi:uncharacterized protein (TIGR03435 family)
MKRLFAVVAVIALFSGSVLGQAPAPRPAFDVAGIQVSTRPRPGMRGGQLRGNRYELRNATMVDLIRTAYNVQPEKITGGPSWLEWNRFDIAALAPEKTPPDQLREMLKTLLAERFKLVVREDTVTTTAMALKVKGTHKLKESSTAGGGCQGQGAPEPNGVTALTATCTGMSMAQFVTQLPQAQSAYFPNGQQLIDETGLSGSWDFQIKFTPRPLLGQAGSDGITLPAALEKIGLIMEPKDIKVPAIVVETATAEFTNPADLAKRLPPAPAPQFEVAVLKPSPPEATQPRAQLRPTGQVDIGAAPLNRIIGLAWNLTDGGARVGDDAYLVGPKWLETARFDVTARAFADTNPANTAQADEDLARMMLRSLLIEKFQIKWHMEDRPMPAFAIVADSPKMTKGDPTKRTRCFEGLPPGSPAAAKPPQFPLLVTCENVSMVQFGQLLPTIAGGYTRIAALDKSGLPGGFDFTLNFSPIEQVQGPRPEAGAANTGVALDPTGALSLQDAVRRQLGLKLEDTKLPVPVLVIDSISEKPLDN